MNIMFIGDICGRPGRHTAAHYIPLLRQQYNLDFVIANGENSAGGVGITQAVLAELFSMGIDVVTTGNHIWDKKEIYGFIDGTDRLLRPANYPPGTPGRGYTIVRAQEYRIGVFNLAGRVFMPAVDCPFREADKIISMLEAECDAIFLDFHAETTSEKMAMGWHLDGRVACVVGTHTHIQTADERILPQGTAYITDLGMVGPWNSVLGVEKEAVIGKFLTGLPARFNLAEGENVFCGCIVTCDMATGRAIDIIRIRQHVN
jgi:metallophosphoesterase (TIGR00282 family)